MDEEEERELDEYMDKFSRAMAENPSLGEPSPGMMWVLRLTARSSKGLPREPGGPPDTPVDPAEIEMWMCELRRQGKAYLEEADELEEYRKRRFNNFQA